MRSQSVIAPTITKLIYRTIGNAVLICQLDIKGLFEILLEHVGAKQLQPEKVLHK